MYIRIIDLRTTSKNEAGLLAEIERIGSELHSVAGYRDLTVFRSYQDPLRYILTSFWENRADAERYRTTCFPDVQERLRPLLTAPLVVRCMEGDELMFARRLSGILNGANDAKKPRPTPERRESPEEAGDVDC